MHYATFFMGLLGLIMVITGVFAKGDTQQTLWGLFGGLLFWTGWIEFIYVYYAHRFGVQPLIVDGEVVTKTEYLIMPSSFGFWIMFMLLYLSLIHISLASSSEVMPVIRQINSSETNDGSANKRVTKSRAGSK